MGLKDVFAAVNALVADGVIEDWALGGAVAATFYLEPVATLDVDIFVTFQVRPGSRLISPQPIFEYLTARGGRIEGEYVVIAEWPVQFLPAPTALVEEAIREAQATEVEGVPVRVFRVEHLAAIALQTGRPKDMARLVQFVESGTLRPDQMEAVLARHGLADAWGRFERKFFGDQS